MKPVHVRDLKDQIGQESPRAILMCLQCGGEYSANAGDYFAADPDTILECCYEPMGLFAKRTSYSAVRV